jgi:hypothetical protein
LWLQKSLLDLSERQQSRLVRQQTVLCSLPTERVAQHLPLHLVETNS